MASITKTYTSTTPEGGSGNTPLKVKAKTANLGNRVAQTDTYTVTATGVTPNKTYTATLVAAPEFVTFDEGTEMSVVKTGGNVTITGTSNSSKLTFTKGGGSIITADISTIKYTASGVNTTNGASITGDPGAKAKYVFTLTLTASSNGTTSERTQQITVTANGAQTKTITLKQAAGDAYINLSETAIEVPQDGTEVTINVTTNTTFSIS